MIQAHPNYYTVGRIQTPSKTEACILSHRFGKPVEWKFGCDETYKNYDWSAEPEQSLDFDDDRRAREIRENYEYVLIAYSGGADSHNVLMSFLRQGLYVDEIFVAHILDVAEKHVDMSGADTSQEAVEAEYKLNVAPKLESLRHLMPNTKITVVDMSERYLNFVDTDDESWILGMTEFRNAHNARFDWFHSVEFKKTLDLGKKTAVVTGLDKPRTYIKDNNFYIFFTDTAFMTGGPYAFSQKHKYSNTYIEYFYWDISTADMVCKQAHLIKKQLEINPMLVQFWDLGKIQIGYRETYRLYHEKLLISLLYTTWDNGFQATKSANGLWNTEYDRWWREIVDTKQLLLYDRGMQYVTENAGEYVMYENGVAQSLSSFTKDYKIGEINTK